MSTTSKSTLKKIEIQFRWLLRNTVIFQYLIKWTFISAFIGTLIGSASAGFLQSLNWATEYREANKWIIIFLPFAGWVIGLLYLYLGKEIEGGNNLLIDTIHEPQALIPFRMAPLVYVGTIVTHLFGGSAGREGTALQMAGAIADQFNKIFKLTTNERKTLITAAVAAGFGSVFGTPLAGAVFALEFFLVGTLRYSAIFPTFIAATFADIITKLWNTPHTHYHIAQVPEITIINLLLSVAAGIFFGLCALTFSKTVHAASAYLKNIIPYTPLRAFAGGALVALAVWLVGTTKYIGLGIPTIVASFEGSLPPYDFAFKMAFTILTLAAGFKGGEVTPLFFIGATLGNALNFLIPLPTELLAGMGFVAVFAGATNTPIACGIMAVELFGSSCGVYVFIACVVAYLLSGNNSIYTKQRLGVAKINQHRSSEGKIIGEIK